tara:strand:- start:378 stop:647 length:270 start_codon:yes stop_codon:yes gene_type:complete
MKNYIRQINPQRKSNLRGLFKVLSKSIKKHSGSIHKMGLLKRSSHCRGASKKVCGKKRDCKYVLKTKKQKGHCRPKRNMSHTVKKFLKM